MQIKDIYGECRALLAENGVDSPDFDARCMIEDVLGDMSAMYFPNREVPQEKIAVIRDIAGKRASGQPLQYLLGQWEFYGLPFKVGEGVLIPRPDTETLVDMAIDICRQEGRTSPKIADLCAGSGCIGISLKHEIPGSQVTAFELSEAALSYLRENAALNETALEIVHMDVLSGDISAYTGYDIIVTNPPYLTAEDMENLQREVRYEPETALFGGEDGLIFYRSIAARWKAALRPGGWLMCEFGMGQHTDIEKILASEGFVNIQLKRDAAGIIRAAQAQKMEE